MNTFVSQFRLISCFLSPLLLLFFFSFRYIRSDKKHINFIEAFTFGMFLVIPVLFLEKNISMFLELFVSYNSFLENLFIIVPIEEGGKFLFFLLLIKEQNSESILDKVLIGVGLGLGFAAFENIIYLINNVGFDIVLLRNTTTVIMHLTSSVLLSYMYSIKKNSLLILPLFIHLTFNTCQSYFNFIFPHFFIIINSIIYMFILLLVFKKIERSV